MTNGKTMLHAKQNNVIVSEDSIGLVVYEQNQSPECLAGFEALDFGVLSSAQ